MNCRYYYKGVVFLKFVKKKEILPKIFLLEFDNQVNLMTTFCRFQEHYESPEFRGRIFSLDEFKEWYAKTYGEWSYYTDWNGCNIPSYILKPFIEGKFDPLTQEEQKLVNLFKNLDHPYYVIGVHKEHDALLHETAHGLYYTNEEYKKKVDDVLKNYETDDFEKELLKIGYCEEVLADEVHAYALSGSKKIEVKLPQELGRRLMVIFKEFSA